ncbi:MAG: epimerase [Terracidiphilus sp.]
MKVLLLGATGMLGQGVLRACLHDPDVSIVQTVGRSPNGISDPKLREIVQRDLREYLTEAELSGFDACFFCLGVSSAGMTETEYRRVTYEIMLAAAQRLSLLNPRLTFNYVSGAGTDSTEQGRMMWARVKGMTENSLLGIPSLEAYIFRPGIIQPLHGARSKTTSYCVLYTMTKPLFPLLQWLFPNQILTTDQIGLAMLNVAKRSSPRRILEIRDIRAAADANTELPG